MNDKEFLKLLWKVVDKRGNTKIKKINFEVVKAADKRIIKFDDVENINFIVKE